MSEVLEHESLAVRWDERLARVAWPAMEEFDVSSIGAGDVVVLCGGFEERASAVLERLVDAGRKDLTVVLVGYLPDNDANRAHDLLAIASTAGIAVREFTYDRQSPAGGGEDILRMANGAGRLHVDISGMSRLLIVQLVVAAVQGGIPMTVVYGEAAEYSPTEDEFEREFEALAGEATLDFLSSGVFEVAATPELGSLAMLGEAIRLIVFPSLETVQMKNLLQEIQPTYMDVIYGTPPASVNAWRERAAEQLNARVLRRQEGVSIHRTSTLNFEETIEVLLEIYGKRNMFDRILIAPTGSKMQAVAVGLVRAVLTDIQVVYPTPQHLKASTYTKGVRRIHQLCIPRVVASF